MPDEKRPCPVCGHAEHVGKSCLQALRKKRPEGEPPFKALPNICVMADLKTAILEAPDDATNAYWIPRVYAICKLAETTQAQIDSQAARIKELVSDKDELLERVNSANTAARQRGNERDRLTTENAELRKDKERLDWQPIDTAPKDGTEFMGGWSNHNHWATGTPMCWQRSNRREGWFMLSPTYENDLGEFFPGKWINARDNPTHWQPLPDPPKAQEGKKP